MVAVPLVHVAAPPFSQSWLLNSEHLKILTVLVFLTKYQFYAFSHSQDK